MPASCGGALVTAWLRAKAHLLDWVTDVDVAAEGLLRERLAVSGLPVLGEEGGGPALADGTAWVVDPVDGTVNLVSGIPLVGVNVALVSEGRVLVAVTCLPFLGELFWAADGAGAWLGDTRLRLDVGGEGVGPVCVDVGDECADGLRPGALRRLGAASVEMGCAAGRYAAVTYRVSRPWDVAAGALLVLEAGGVVCPRLPGEDWLSDSVVAGHPRAVERVLAAVRG